MDRDVKSVRAWVEERTETGPYFRLCIPPFTCRVDEITKAMLGENADPEGDFVGKFYVEVVHGEYDTEIWSGECDDLESGKQTAVSKLKEYIAKITEQLEAVCGTQE